MNPLAKTTLTLAAGCLIVSVVSPLGAPLPAESEESKWALAPLELPAIPEQTDAGWVQTPIDAFILAKLREHGLEPSPRADKRTLIRRLYFDLIGLPPTPEDVGAFLADGDADAFEKVVDRLLASARYGERWARHWMDVVHYAETQGHDEDAVRENAWPYRDYLIRSFNEDKPYARFVQEQVAGDVLFPDDPWATVATGFVACGPWDGSSQMGIQDGTTDKKIAQYLDRDDMLTTTMSTFVSTTAHCARCHDHKFDPITTEDYYALQAVFAGVDRVDRPFESEPEQKRKRDDLQEQQRLLAAGKLPPTFERSDAQQAALEVWVTKHRQGIKAWSGLGSQEVASTGAATHEILQDGSIRFSGERPERDTYTIAGVAQINRVTAVLVEVMTDESLHLQGPGRQDNGNLHLSEVKILVGDSDIAVPIGRAVADFDQAGWTVAHSIDGNPKTAWGIYPKVGESHRAMFVLSQPVDIGEGEHITVVLEQLHGGGHLIGRPRIALTNSPDPKLPPAFRPDVHLIAGKASSELTSDEQRQLALAFLRERVANELESLQRPNMVFAIANDWKAKGNFVPAKGPRPVHILDRGDINSPGDAATPGALSCLVGPPARFELEDPNDEGARRAALAEWLAAPENVLTWRSITNRVWHHHFGRGIVTTPNDFGAMGARPSHPDLLDWLAYKLRAGGGSLKWLHRIICTSASYAQSASPNPQSKATELRFASRRRLDAESIRDAVLQMSGKLDLTMGGPSARQFTSTKGVHITPALDYLNFDPDNPANFRRSAYRFVFRTVPDPLMQALDCPDASQLTPKRDVSVTALQALAMMNNRFLVRQCEHMAERLISESPDPSSRVIRLFELAYSRTPSETELRDVTNYAETHGLANACRIIINSGEFIFVD